MTLKMARPMTIPAFILLFVAAPIWGMLNCDGWSASDMEVASCEIDTSFLRSYANWYIGWFVISSYGAWLPIWLYLGLVGAGAEIAARFFASTGRRKARRR